MPCTSTPQPLRSTAEQFATDLEDLLGLIRQRQLKAVFQPLVNLQTGEPIGHEALIRGPATSALHQPDRLFSVARQASLGTLLEKASAEQALCDWRVAADRSHRCQHDLLFINMSAQALVRVCRVGGHANGLVDCQAALANAIEPTRLVIEITEHDKVADMKALLVVRQQLSEAGVRMALDDFGDGHANLRFWHELRPDFVKIDKYFIRDIAAQPDKQHLLRSIQGIAQLLGATLIAEGIETRQEWQTLREMGIPIGQGYFLGRPSPALVDGQNELLKALYGRRVHAVDLPTHTGTRHAVPSILDTLPLTQAPTVLPDTPHNAVAALFQEHPELHAIPVVQADAQPVGLINRRQFMDQFAKLYFREVHGKRPCMPSANQAPRIVERSDRINDLLAILTSHDQRYLADGFIVTDQGSYVGLGTGEQLVRAVTEARIEAARHANPLTLLPGNIPLNVHVQWLLDEDLSFVACYADLDHFKPFNDRYGYRRGDEMIRLLARLATDHCLPDVDFVGHIGGDDFMLLMRSPDWESRCQTICAAFAVQAAAMFDEHERLAGGFESEDRSGRPQFFPCTTVSIGAVHIHARDFSDAEDVALAASSAKHEAKRLRHGVHVLTGG